MHLLLTVALAAIFQLALPPVVRAADWGAYKTAQVDKRVERYFARRDLRGRALSMHALSLAVGIDGAPVLAKGYGEARPGSPATERTVYHIGSLTKQFTAVAVLSLIESKAKAPLSSAPVAINSPVRDFFTGIAGWQRPDTPSITVRSLLTMTSALPSLTDHPPVAADPWGAIPAQHLLEAVKHLKPTPPPIRFAYNNTSYFLLAELVEATIGSHEAGAATYRDYLRSAILAKAGLRDTGFIGDYASGTAAMVATPFWRPDTPRYRRRPAFVHGDWLKGSADMASSATDLFMWNKALMEDRILGRSSRNLMFSDAARPARSQYYGLGWFIEHANGWDKYSHSGLVPGYSLLNIIMQGPQGGTWISVSILTNTDGIEDLDKLANDIVQVALQ